jgi:hypothetical protein
VCSIKLTLIKEIILHWQKKLWLKQKPHLNIVAKKLKNISKYLKFASSSPYLLHNNYLLLFFKKKQELISLKNLDDFQNNLHFI